MNTIQLQEGAQIQITMGVVVLVRISSNRAQTNWNRNKQLKQSPSKGDNIDHHRSWCSSPPSNLPPTSKSAGTATTSASKTEEKRGTEITMALGARHPPRRKPPTNIKSNSNNINTNTRCSITHLPTTRSNNFTESQQKRTIQNEKKNSAASNSTTTNTNTPAMEEVKESHAFLGAEESRGGGECGREIKIKSSPLRNSAALAEAKSVGAQSPACIARCCFLLPGHISSVRSALRGLLAPDPTVEEHPSRSSCPWAPLALPWPSDGCHVCGPMRSTRRRRPAGDGEGKRGFLRSAAAADAAAAALASRAASLRRRRCIWSAPPSSSDSSVPSSSAPAAARL